MNSNQRPFSQMGHIRLQANWKRYQEMRKIKKQAKPIQVATRKGNRLYGPVSDFNGEQN